jgi:hypothetical protein
MYIQIEPSLWDISLVLLHLCIWDKPLRLINEDNHLLV